MLIGIIRINARRTDLSHQTLGDHQTQNGGDKIRRHVQIEEARHGGRRIVRVERRKDQVAGEGRLHGDISRFRIADLADHDDVRVLAQERTETRSKRDAGLRIDLRLVHIAHIVFDRVFDRGDIDLRTVQDVHQSIQRRRFSGTGRTAGQDHAVGSLEIFRDDLHGLGRHTDLLEG